MDEKQEAINALHHEMEQNKAAQARAFEATEAFNRAKALVESQQKTIKMLTTTLHNLVQFYGADR